jgi:acetoin utilization deacetylase AcuC-like enzyme
VHHGNGDSDISFCDPTRLYASSHEAELWPKTGATWGCDGLHGQILNAPLPPGCGSDEFREAWQSTILPAVREFEPEAIFLSAGFDAHADDPLASMQLTDDDFSWITAQCCALGGGSLPIISVLEGGYNIDALEGSVRAHLDALVHS